MSGRMPPLRGREIMRALERAGFELRRTRGSHHIYRHKTDKRRSTTVPDHGTRQLPIGTLKAIIAQAGLTEDEFKTYL
jgi:predicted RNA binding protein YcfA (HicA-like mRNA interferase family)